jgi:hypothetical protein
LGLLNLQEQICQHQLHQQNIQKEILEQASQLSKIHVSYQVFCVDLTTAFQYFLQADASHFRDVRQKQQEEQFELQNARAWTEVSAKNVVSPCSFNAAMQEYVRKHQLQLQSLQQEISAHMSQLAHLRVS